MAPPGGNNATTTTTRTPSWKERENNRVRERRRRAIAANIFSGLRSFGNYNLPKHCDNNEVLKALCSEAGWIVEPDGTTYRKGRKPPPHLVLQGKSASMSTSPCVSYQPSPGTSFNPSPVSSSLASPASSSYVTNSSYLDGGSLIPWLKNLATASSSTLSSKLPNHYIQSGSISAPVTPPFCSPGRQTVPDSDWWRGIGGPTSPTYTLMSSHPFGSFSSQMLSPLQSGTCSPALPAGFDHTADVPMSEVISDEFVFKNSSKGVVKAWEGERIHEVCGTDDLELTLGCPKKR